MAFQQIDARTILVTETPQVAVFPDRPEPPRQEDRKLTRADLKKTKFPRATDAEFAEIIEGSGFPPAGKRTAFGGSKVTLIWSERIVDRWIAERVAAAKKTLRLLGA